MCLFILLILHKILWKSCVGGSEGMKEALDDGECLVDVMACIVFILDM